MINEFRIIRGGIKDRSWEIYASRAVRTKSLLWVSFFSLDFEALFCCLHLQRAISFLTHIILFPFFIPGQCHRPLLRSRRNVKVLL